MGTGISALVTQNQSHSSLWAAIDIERLEKSVSHLGESISFFCWSSFPKQVRFRFVVSTVKGTLCGPGKRMLFLYRSFWDNKGLAKKKSKHEATKGWFESWFNCSPWLTTLIPILLGSLLILLFLLTIGPCLLNKLIQFIKQRLGTIQLMVQCFQTYIPVRTEETKLWEMERPMIGLTKARKQRGECEDQRNSIF